MTKGFTVPWWAGNASARVFLLLLPRGVLGMLRRKAVS